MPYDKEFEAKIEVYRRRQRLLVASNIHFKATPADFMNVCRTKLSNPESVTFFWREPNEPHNTHNGWCMLGFELRSECQRAEEDLKQFEYRGRQITIKKAGRKAVRDRLMSLRIHDG
jgi:hypothetical protein